MAASLCLVVEMTASDCKVARCSLPVELVLPAACGWCLGRWTSIKKSIVRPVRRLCVLGLVASIDLQAFVVPTAEDSPKTARHVTGVRALLASLQKRGCADFYELGRFAGRVMSMSAAVPRVRLHLTAVHCALTNRKLVSCGVLRDSGPWWTHGAKTGMRAVRRGLVAPLIEAIETILALLTGCKVFRKFQRHT